MGRVDGWMNPPRNEWLREDTREVGGWERETVLEDWARDRARRAGREIVNCRFYIVCVYRIPSSPRAHDTP